MKVLFESYYDIGRIYGGGPSVVYNLAESLTNIGVEITFHDYWKHDPKQFDLIHYFSCYDNYNWLRHWSDPPLVVTPISWFAFSKWARFKRKTKFLLQAALHRTLDRGRLGYPEVVPKHWFPNSTGEAHYLSQWLGISAEAMNIVPHGVHRRFSEGDGRAFEQAFGLKDFVLCVGRFEYPRKNQLSLIRALRDDSLPLVFIGGPDVGHQSYYEQCREEAGKCAVFLPPMKHDDPLLRSAFHACKVIAQPALLESPGLVGLEGALGGANVATTFGGATRETYADCAWYFDPKNTVSIRSAVLEAHAASRDERMKARALTFYTWDKIAEVQKAAYERVLQTYRSVPTT